MNGKRAAGLTAIIAVLLGGGYVALKVSPADESPGRPARDHYPEVIAFSADGWVWSYSPTSARRIVRVDAPLDRPPAFGRYVAVDARGELVVLSPRAGGAIAIVDVGRRQVIRRGRLPRRVSGRAIVVGPRTGRLYVVGRRVRPGRTRFGARRSEAVLLVRASNPRRALGSALVRASAGHDWDVFGVAVSPAEDLLAVSYHGDDTSGVDIVNPGSPSGTRCPRPTTADRACIPAAHGDVEFGQRGLVAASGTEQLLEFGRAGFVRRRDTRLVDSHVTALLLGSGGDAVFSVPQCGYVGGLSRLELRSGTVTLLAAPRESEICGGEMAQPSRGTLVTAGSGGAPAGANVRLQWINLANGRVDAERTTRSPILALAAAP